MKDRTNAALATGIVVFLCVACVTPTGKPASMAANPECPHTWTMPGPATTSSGTVPPQSSSSSGGNAVPPVAGGNSPSAPSATGIDATGAIIFTTTIPASGLAISPLTTNVPEFHDCQRMRVPANPAVAAAPDSMVYGALIGVFARDSLDAVSDSALAAWVVLGLTYVPMGGNYLKLGIKTPFSCILVKREGATAQAKMVSVSDEAKCKPFPPAADVAAATALQVRVKQRMDPFIVPDIPPVARWDWDESRKEQFIGIRCGDAWCEIGSPGVFGESSTYPNADLTGLDKRNLEYKGWYDEQHLAEYKTTAASATALISTSPNIGTVVPTAELQAFNAGTGGTSGWVPVATITTRKEAGSYENNFNFAPTTGTPPTGEKVELSICRGNWRGCRPKGFRFFKPSACDPDADGVRWYARVRRAEHRDKYFCVIFRGHTGNFTIPAVARWRWRATDETIWISCPAGCCEVNADQ